MLCAGVLVAVGIGLCAATAQAKPQGQSRVRPAIVGGQTAPVGSFGMMAFVVYLDQDGTPEFACSGTVISPNVVLTAGHCGEDLGSGVPYAVGGYRVVTSALDWTSSTRQVSGVSRVVIAPDFDPSTLDGDAALLVLSTPTSAPAIALASYPADAQLLSPGTAADIAGWGETESEPLATALQWGTDVIQRSTYCSAQASLQMATFDASRQLCTINAPSYSDGTCEGDSGGPLLAQRSNGTWVEVGVTSSGPSNCNTRQPDFFTRADAISAWAAAWVRASAPSPSPPALSSSPAPPSSAVQGPPSGTYTGRTSQHWPITLRVTSSRASMSALRFSFSLSCARHRRLSFKIAPIRPHATWKLGGTQRMQFAHTFTDRTGERYHISGTFTGAGGVAGVLTTSWRTRRYGACASGLVRWRAGIG